MRRILSIDGGGIKGAFPASLLASVEDEIGCSISEYFDLIVGTSTGGIIALALGLGIPASKVRDFYVAHGPAIFKQKRLSWLSRFLNAKYNQSDLQAALEEVFGSKLLGDSKRRLMIPSYNIETGRVHVYKTRHHSRLEKDHKIKMLEVALATSAAPTYFKPFLNKGIPLVDGGMWANNPIDSAIVEALTVLGWRRDEINVLSLGCTFSALNIDSGRKIGRGDLYWAKNSADVFLQAQSAGAMAKAELLIGEESILRINSMAPNGRFELDRVSEICSLVGIGESVAREMLPKIRKQFIADGKAELFTPETLIGDVDWAENRSVQALDL